jgi:1,2-dihydroxy-3-keto-5-methylthiopentene dioxygenase
MSRLTIYKDDAPDQAILRTEDAATITEELNAIGVRFERWQSPVALSRMTMRRPSSPPTSLISTR